MKNIIIILDAAHGVDVKGKSSPDGSHREYKWSRERVSKIKTILTAMGYKVYLTNNTDVEIGLSTRKNIANNIEGKNKLLLSLHNNASGSDGQWKSAQGTAVYTTKGVTNSDICADIIFKQFKEDFPEIKMRNYSTEKYGNDFEENFTVLMGNSYMAVLIEWLFQDNKEDVVKLKDSTMNKRFEDSLVSAIEKINSYFASV